jgi:hypothetical protein
MTAALASLFGPIVDGVPTKTSRWRAIFRAIALARMSLFAVRQVLPGETNKDTVRQWHQAHSGLSREPQF